MAFPGPRPQNEALKGTAWAPAGAFHRGLLMLPPQAALEARHLACV
jgi:hypothetical protein